MAALQKAIDYAKSHENEFLKHLKELLRIKSISTLPEHKGQMVEAADWLANQLNRLGFSSVEVMPTAGHPVAYGERLKAGADAPTILMYGHYDVQPADPLELWKSDPFEPEIRGDDLFARGASDMKGQVVAHIKAVESILEVGELPVNLKYFLEGEEEIGSPNLPAFILDNESMLAADLCLNADSGIIDADIPSITYALRGLAYFELRLQAQEGDLHSGTYGGAVDNPANVLAHLIAGMKDRRGRITIPGFYDDVGELSEQERSDLASLPQTDEWWKEQAAARELFVETGYTPTEGATARPTLDVNGMLSGFTGEGSKTVLPAKAMAKISMRLVPDQDPTKVEQLLRDYLESNVPPTVSWELINHAGAIPAILERDSTAVRAAQAALEDVWGKPPLFKREGGTVPVVGMIKELLGIDTLMLGFGLPDDNLHAPNEKFHMPNFYRGIRAFIRFMTNMQK
jgi:acetylornithine deacetylase/succinyl-diaminopimelate desuccinylase-like protein